MFDDEYAGVANLDPDLLRALRRAATDAEITFYVNSGWRSPERQEQLLRDAVAKYGSEEEAARWVATAKRSRHVAGDAVDLGRSDALSWLSEHGAEHGLCQIYLNEPWHYELRADAADQGCPRMYADPTQDPRMRPVTADSRPRRWKRGPVLAALALLLGLILLLHPQITDRGGLGNLVENFLPWLGVGIPVLLTGALSRRLRSRAGRAAAAGRGVAEPVRRRCSSTSPAPAATSP